MAFIGNDKIVVAGRKLRVHLHHAGVGREMYTRLVIDSAAFNARPVLIRKVFLEFIHGLANQFAPIGQEKDALHPPGAHQEIDQANSGARLPGTRRHHQQKLAPAQLHCFCDSSHCIELVTMLVTSSNSYIWRYFTQTLAIQPLKGELLKILWAEEAADAPGWIAALTIIKQVNITIREKNKWANLVELL